MKEKMNSIKRTARLAGFIYLFAMATSIFGGGYVPCQGQTKIDQAKKLFEEKKYAETEKLLLPIDDDDRDYAAAQYYLGRIAYARQKYDDASDYFEEAVDANDKVADYHHWLGNTYRSDAMNSGMIRQGMLAPKMKTAWENAAALDAKNIDARTSLIEFYIQAPGFMGGGIDKAKKMVTQVFKLNPTEGHRDMGSIFMAEKNYEKAFASFEEALKGNPEDYTSLYQIGKASALTGQKLDRGEECLKKYLTHTPQQNESSQAGAYMRLAQIKEKKGNKAEARKYYEVALKQDDSLKEAKEGLERTSK